MKKLLCSLVVTVAVAIGVKANSVDWLFSAPGTSTVLASGTAYLILQSNWSSSLGASDLAGVASDSAAIVKYVGKYQTKSQSYDLTDTAGTTYNYYIVVVTSDLASYYKASVSGVSYDPSGTGTITSATFTSASDITTSDLTSFSAVPEPGSIGLLMLGLCALGLKRKIS